MKSKILELMYSWTLGLPHEVKISEAYQMLKKQGERQCSERGRGTDGLPFPVFCPGRIQNRLSLSCAQTQHSHQSGSAPGAGARAGALGLLAGQRELLVV